MIPTKAELLAITNKVLAGGLGHKIPVILRGESVPFEFDRAGRSIKGWRLVVTVHASLFERPLVCREVKAYKKSWPGFLTSWETLDLPDGGYYLTGILCGEKKKRERVGLNFIVKGKK